MSSRYVKYNPNTNEIVVNPIYNILPSTNTTRFTCVYCGEEVIQPASYVVYTFNEKQFCSHNCKHKYIKEHPDEKEITASEYALAKFERDRKKTIKNHMRKYYERKTKKE